MFSVACNLTKTTSNFCSSSNVDFSTVKITLKKFSCIFRPAKLHQKSTWKQSGFFDHQNYAEKVLGNDADFSTVKITMKKLRGKNVDILTSEITWKKAR